MLTEHPWAARVSSQSECWADDGKNTGGATGACTRGAAVSAPERLSVGVVVERRELSHRWQTGASWTVIGLQPAAPGSVKDWSCLAEGDGWQHYYAGAVEIELFRGETEGYRDNLSSARPPST